MGFRLANVGGRAVLVDGSDYYDVETVSGGALSHDLMALLARTDSLTEVSAALHHHKPTGQVDTVVLGPPVPAPKNSFGIGLNYLDHAAESSMEVPENPLVFTKFPSCLVGPTADVEMRSDFCDYEGELVIVIGTGGKDIAPERAWDHVVGVMIGQDISDRKAQFASKPPHFDLGKSFDTFGPIGPHLVSLDQIPDPAELRILTHVNGEERQNDVVDSLVFDVPTLIAYLSQITTLTTGDLIFTGTPAGIGAGQGLFLADGDVITTTIEGVGVLTNRCRRVSDHSSPGDRPKGS